MQGQLTNSNWVNFNASKFVANCLNIRVFWRTASSTICLVGIFASCYQNAVWNQEQLFVICPVCTWFEWQLFSVHGSSVQCHNSFINITNNQLMFAMNIGCLSPFAHLPEMFLFCDFEYWIANVINDPCLYILNSLVYIFDMTWSVMDLPCWYIYA